MKVSQATKEGLFYALIVILVSQIIIQIINLIKSA
jgi:hypothetical protein